MNLSWSKSASAELIKMTQQWSSKSSDKFRAIKPINILFPRPYAKTTHLWILKSKCLLVQPLMFLNVCCFKPNCCWQKELTIPITNVSRQNPPKFHKNPRVFPGNNPKSHPQIDGFPMCSHVFPNFSQ